ncbi:hypothetical protein PIB30_047961 [Stylosanthes scabra]|uniref:RING-type E3 ubiquitin transferase n=1 Tax=Stylosanthes scabra TaxID=79078 RepID=A0ABU6QG94_9FABA|nr:hypothetical protein [Stylosanthes scabra]
MEISIRNLLALAHLFVILSFSASYIHNLDDSSEIFTYYGRTAEIEKYCVSYLSLASKLGPDANRVSRIKRELSFNYGDWEQEDGHAPLMPFNPSPSNGFQHSLALKLVSFKVVDISSLQHFENTVSLGGIMSIGIAGADPYFPTHSFSFSSSSFTKWPGSSLLRIAFQGVYLQINDHENGKEHLIFLEQVIRQPFDILQNYNDRHVASRLGPFQLGKEFSSDWTHQNFRLFFQNLMCEEEESNNNVQSARVSAVLRAFPASLPIYPWQERTGLSGLTLSAEGTWDSSTRKLCMTGCVNSALDSEECNYQISLHYPNVFSIKQRSVMLGSIYSITDETNTSFMPLLFDSLRRPSDLKSLGLYNNTYYSYSKVELAAANKKKNQPSKLFTSIKELFLKYPTLVDGLDSHAHLNLLSNKLNFHGCAVHQQSLRNQNSMVYMQMEVLSLDASYQHEATEPEEKNLINISLHLTFSERYLDESAVLFPYFLEGVYDPLAGDMHLIGCRKVSSNDNSSVDHGLDCLLEVMVQYPSESTRWLKHPSVEMTITSQRSAEDVLHFKPITLKTTMNSYNEHEQDCALMKIFEGVLKLLISLAAVGIIWSQLCYMNSNEGSIPYMSLGTLALLIFGYGAELITATEILFESNEYSSRNLLYGLQIPTILLVLVSLLLTVKQHQKVSEAKNMPNGYYFVPAMAMILKVLALKMQDLFLMPQVIENIACSSQVRPLRKTYYLGLTLLRLIIHFYHYIRDPVMDPFNNHGGDAFINNQVGIVLLHIFHTMIPIIMILFASVVYIQQSWNYLKSRNP